MRFYSRVFSGTLVIVDHEILSISNSGWNPRGLATFTMARKHFPPQRLSAKTAFVPVIWNKKDIRLAAGAMSAGAG